MQLTKPELELAQRAAQDAGGEVHFHRVEDLQRLGRGPLKYLPVTVADSTLGYNRVEDRVGGTVLLATMKFECTDTAVPLGVYIVGTGGCLRDARSLLEEVLGIMWGPQCEMKQKKILVVPHSRSIPKPEPKYDTDSIVCQLIAIELLLRRGFSVISTPEVMEMSEAFRTVEGVGLYDPRKSGYDCHLTNRGQSFLVKTILMYGAHLTFCIGWNSPCPISEMRTLLNVLKYE